jgi:predicted ATP-dependent endonuclease of OLD family
MYISKLEIEGYKNCKSKSKILLKSGLNIIVGENGSGKTTIINALRLLLKENEYSHSYVVEQDFYKSFETREISERIKLDLELKDLSDEEKVTFFSWCNGDFNAELHYEASSKPNKKGYYNKSIWGGASKASAFEEETFDCIDCVYLPPLRDAEEKLTNGKKSRIATLLKHEFLSEESKKDLESSFSNFNSEFIVNQENKEIGRAKKNINNNLEESMGKIFGQSISLQFSDSSFNSILQNIKMIFFPQIGELDIDKFRDIAINSLGYNNLLYIATVFAELNAIGKTNNLFTVLLIEEPEAHLHPQLQIKLIKYFEKIQSKNKNMQIIITTHSPVLASSCNIENLIYLREYSNAIQSTPLDMVNLGDSKNYINRWLDVTKSTLFFSKGIILVEGISECLLLPELSKIVLRDYNNNPENIIKLPSSLDEASVSIININGINFKHFMKLFSNITADKNALNVPLKCSGITDNDPEHGSETNEYIKYPDFGEVVKGENPAILLKNEINRSEYAKLFISPLKTFEYDLAISGNTKIMAKTISNIWPTDGSVKNNLSQIEKDEESNLRRNSIYIFKHIDVKEVGKAIFAQVLADSLKSDSNASEKFVVPDYIKKAVLWACGVIVDE